MESIGQPSCTQATVSRVHGFNTENTRVREGSRGRPGKQEAQRRDGQTSPRAFLGSGFRSGGRAPGASSGPSPPRIKWGQRAGRGIGLGERRDSRPRTPVHTLPTARRVSRAPPPSFLPLRAPLPSPETRSPGGSPPLPSPPSQAHPLRPVPSGTPSHPFPAPTSVGRGAWGAGPLPGQAAAAVVAGGCVSASFGVSVPRGRQGLGAS